MRLKDTESNNKAGRQHLIQDFIWCQGYVSAPPLLHLILSLVMLGYIMGGAAGAFLSLTPCDPPPPVIITPPRSEPEVASVLKSGEVHGNVSHGQKVEGHHLLRSLSTRRGELAYCSPLLPHP